MSFGSSALSGYDIPNGFKVRKSVCDPLGNQHLDICQSINIGYGFGCVMGFLLVILLRGMVKAYYI